MKGSESFSLRNYSFSKWLKVTYLISSSDWDQNKVEFNYSAFALDPHTLINFASRIWLAYAFFFPPLPLQMTY